MSEKPTGWEDEPKVEARAPGKKSVAERRKDREARRAALEREIRERNDEQREDVEDLIDQLGLNPLEVAVVATDAGVGELLAALAQKGGKAVVCADHGNAEQMWDPTVNGPHTAHTLNLVEVFAVGEGLVAGKTKMRSGGRLADIAPTVLHLMGLPKPAEMTGESLISG